MSFRLKQIGLSLCLMASLLVGSASACACAHHQEAEKTEELSCHGGGHEETAKVEVPVGTTKIDADCTCFVSQSSPVIVSKSESKKSSTSDEVGVLAADLAVPEFIYNGETGSSLPASSRQFAKSTILESLLPARAPPRL